MSRHRPRQDHSLRRAASSVTLATAAFVAGCAAPPPPPGSAPPAPPAAASATAPSCPAGAGGPATITEAYFGRAGSPQAPRVSDVQWARFLAEEVTPRFPQGLTVLDSRGQWRDPDTGRIARERSRVLVLVLPDTDEATARTRLAPAVAAYLRRFRQRSVLVTTRAGCASF